MSNPLDDPRAKDLMSAVPDDVQALWQSYKSAAGKAQWSASSLRTCQADRGWTGKAADQFRSSIGRLPAQLGAVCNGYWEVANALQSYEGQLRDLQTRYASVSHDYSTAHLRYTVSKGQVDGDLMTYRQDLDPRNHASRPKMRSDYGSLTTDVGTLDSARTELTHRTAAVVKVLDDFEHDRNVCRLTVRSAMGYALTKPSRPAGPAPHAPGATNHGNGTGGSHDGGSHSGGSHGGATGSDGHRPSTSRIGTSGPALDTGAPASAKAKVTAMTHEADRLLGIGYVYGGGHGGSFDTKHGLDCSSFVSNVLHAGGYLHAPQTTDTLPGQPGIVDGPGKYVTIYDRPDAGDNSHVIIDVNGQFYEEGGGEDGVPEDVHKLNPSQSYLNSFTRLMHPQGL